MRLLESLVKSDPDRADYQRELAWCHMIRFRFWAIGEEDQLVVGCELKRGLRVDGAWGETERQVIFEL